MALGETRRVQFECAIRNPLACRVARLGLAAMHRRRCHVANAGVAVLVVVPGEEDLTERARLLDGVETCRELRSILQCFELRLGVRIVIADVRPAVALGHTEIDRSLAVQPLRAQARIIFQSSRVCDLLEE